MPIPSSAQNAKNTDTVIQCHECNKWQLLYTKNVLTSKEKSELNNILENVQYSCGSVMQDIEHEDDSILTKVYVRENLTCESSMEIPYYGTNHEPVCFHCGQEDELQNFVDKYPICKHCLKRTNQLSQRGREKQGLQFLYPRMHDIISFVFIKTWCLYSCSYTYIIRLYV